MSNHLMSVYECFDPLGLYKTNEDLFKEYLPFSVQVNNYPFQANHSQSCGAFWYCSCANSVDQQCFQTRLSKEYFVLHKCYCFSFLLEK